MGLWERTCNVFSSVNLRRRLFAQHCSCPRGQWSNRGVVDVASKHGLGVAGLMNEFGDLGVSGLTSKHPGAAGRSPRIVGG